MTEKIVKKNESLSTPTSVLMKTLLIACTLWSPKKRKILPPIVSTSRTLRWKPENSCIVDGEFRPTVREACGRRSLWPDDELWKRSMQESFRLSFVLHSENFAVSLSTYSPSDPGTLPIEHGFQFVWMIKTRTGQFAEYSKIRTLSKSMCFKKSTCALKGWTVGPSLFTGYRHHDKIWLCCMHCKKEENVFQKFSLDTDKAIAKLNED